MKTNFTYFKSLSLTLFAYSPVLVLGQGGGLPDPIGELPGQLNPVCTDITPWANYFPQGVDQHTDFITLCPDFTRVTVGGYGTGARLTLGSRYLSPTLINDLNLEWTNDQWFKSLELENNTVIKWHNPGLIGIDSDNQPVWGWSHGLVQDQDYGLRFVRSQTDDNASIGYTSFGIRNDGDVEIMHANLINRYISS